MPWWKVSVWVRYGLAHVPLLFAQLVICPVRGHRKKFALCGRCARCARAVR